MEFLYTNKGRKINILPKQRISIMDDVKYMLNYKLDESPNYMKSIL